MVEKHTRDCGLLGFRGDGVLSVLLLGAVERGREGEGEGGERGRKDGGREGEGGGREGA